MSTAVDFKLTIVSGADLRTLLASDHITYGEISAALKEKGIYVGNSDKAITIPILSATLLTPDDFSRLIENCVDRESVPKTKVSALTLTSADADWIEPLKEGLFAGFDPLEASTVAEFVVSPSVVVHDSSRASIPYQICRRDFSRDWIQRELIFEGEIVLERKGSDIKLDFVSTHSSKETEAVNRRIVAEVAKVLHASALVSTSEPIAIKFGSFNNEERVRYFKRLTAGIEKVLGVGSVNDIEVSLDPEGGALPDDPQISWMKQTVRRLTIDGNRLNDIFLIADEKYYKHYHILRMNVTYPFSEGANVGSCRVGFSFGAPTRGGISGAELTFECVKWMYDVQPNSDAKKSIAAAVHSALRALVEQKFKQALAERSPSASPVTVSVPA